MKRFLVAFSILIFLCGCLFTALILRFPSQAALRFHNTASEFAYRHPNALTKSLWQYSIDNPLYRAYLSENGIDLNIQKHTYDEILNASIKLLSDRADIDLNVVYTESSYEKKYSDFEILEEQIESVAETQVITIRGERSFDLQETGEVIRLSSDSSDSKELFSRVVPEAENEGRDERIVSGTANLETVKNQIIESLAEEINQETQSVYEVSLFETARISYEETEPKVGEAKIKLNGCNYYVTLPIIFNIEAKQYSVVDLDLLETYECTENDFSSPEVVEMQVCEDCFLAVVDKNHRLPSWYEPEIIGGEINTVPYSVEPRVQPHFDAMLNAAIAEGHDVNITSSHRDFAKQVDVFDYWADYNQEVYGHSRERAVLEANNVSAFPGFSEHQLGTTVDVTAMECIAFDGFCQHNEDIWAWLRDNAYKYGFALSYPQNSKDRTGYKFEPWHYRWIGRVNALAFKGQSEMTLNEWLTEHAEFLNENPIRFAN